MNRRESIKSVPIGSAVLELGNAVFHKPLEALASGKYDIGQCKNVSIKCISEPTVHDLKKLLAEIEAGEGPQESQRVKLFDPQNALGNCALIDVELLDASHHKFLLDTGWNSYYMDQAFKREGIDKMLTDSELEFLLISHECPDHFCGLEITLKYKPDIKIIIPSTFNPEGMHFVYGVPFNGRDAGNRISHQGELIKLALGTINKLYPGVAAVNFDCRPKCSTRGEQSLYFNVKDKGMVLVTGCCHQSTITFADFAIGKIKDGDKMYGIYGGLHIAPFGTIDPEREYIIKEMGKYNFKKIACNHCTGLPAVERMIQLGYPVFRGTARFGSRSDLYIGNGDEVFFD